MKNTPNKIYLQTALEDNGETCEDFKELSNVSWADEKIYCDDLEFISVDFILRRIKELEEQKFDTTTKDGQYNFNLTSTVINELKNLIK